MADSVAVIVVDGFIADANEQGIFIHPIWAPRRDLSFVQVISFEEVVKFCIVVQSLSAVFRVVVFRVVVFLNVELWLLVSCLAFGRILELDLSLLAMVGNIVNHFFLGVNLGCYGRRS